MCGIVGAVAERDVVPILIEGLKRLEYRGYDSAGVAVLSDASRLERLRRAGKVRELEEGLHLNPIRGTLGIAHKRSEYNFFDAHGICAKTYRKCHTHDKHCEHKYKAPFFLIYFFF